jgi:hypothetical protein
MINKLRLQYYKLIIKYYSLFEKKETIEIFHGWCNTPYNIKTNTKRSKIIKYTTLYNDLYSIIYPEKIKIECLDACGLDLFEEATINLKNNQNVPISIITYMSK